MCLSFEWFDESEMRKKKWDVSGLSLEDAKGALFTYYSTVYPIATEMAEYIFKNWTARRVALLDLESRKILFDIWDKHLSESVTNESEKVEGGYSFKGVYFEAGTKLRVRDNPDDFAEITSDGISYKGNNYLSFSAAANVARPHTNNNGWIQWEYYEKGSDLWNLVDQKRKATFS